ncbi:MAG: adenosine deaminase [Acidimicrobiia bacterium]|nr:adenosine deaminase [Acidimicrobiia bacterium]
MNAAVPSPEEIRQAPKALLHDHLDGGLRPATIVELAAETGYRGLPTGDPAELGRWMTRAASGESLEAYLETFVHTLGVMQTPQSIARVAAECAEDLAADGVVYAEVRFAPELHTERGLSTDEVVRSVLDGFAAGSRGRSIRVVGLLCAMRHAAHALEVAELAVRHRHDGIVGFDIAGAEAGHPPTRHIAAFQYLQRANFHFTIHAGEGFGLPSIWEAVQYCGAERLGHGVRIVEDIALDADDPEAAPQLGPLAAYVRDRRIPLELCPSSNVHTALAPSIAEHPIDLLARLRFRVTINTDNRLMSDTCLSKEMQLCAEAYGWTLSDLRWLTINAIKSSFIPFDERLHLIDNVIKPGYARLAAG